MNKAIQTSKASIVPDISLMKKIASISGTIPSRIMELVDNSIDAKVKGQVLNIQINIVKNNRTQYIEVIDNGIGMNEETAQKFFKLADSQKDAKKNIGRFGLGAKVAILGLGNKSKISTKPMNEDYRVEIDFDINKFSDWSIDYKTKQANNEEHGTVIRIEDVTVRIGDVKKLANRIEEQIAKTYKHFIRNGEVVIHLNRKVVKPHSVDVIDDFYQDFDFTVNGKRVYGWAGAMRQAGTNWKFGFDLINNGRIIKSNDFLSRQAHTSLARLVGEIHLDEFGTDVHKTDFLRDTEDFQEMQDILLNDVLYKLISQISQLTNQDIFAKYQDNLENISSRLNRILNSREFLSQLDIGDNVFSSQKSKTTKKAAFTVTETEVTVEEDDLEDVIDEPKEKRERNKRDPRIGFIVEEPVLMSMGEDNSAKKWQLVERENGTSLRIEINMDHPTFKVEEEIETYIKNTVFDSIAEFVVREEKKNNGMIDDEIERLINIKDMLVRQTA